MSELPPKIRRTYTRLVVPPVPTLPATPSTELQAAYSIDSSWTSDLDISGIPGRFFPDSDSATSPITPATPDTSVSSDSTSSHPYLHDARNKRPYRRLIIPEIPVIPHISTSETPSSTLPFRSRAYSLTASSPSPSHPDHLLGSPFPHSLPRRHAEPRTSSERMQNLIDSCMDNYESLGHGFMALFESDLQSLTPRHRAMIQKFLQGKTTYKPLDIVQAMYDHRYSYPSYRSEYKSQRDAHFSPTADLSACGYARPAISSWACRLVGEHVHREIDSLTREDPEDTTYRARLAASANKRAQKPRIVTWKDLESFSIRGLVSSFASKAPLSWYLTECMAGPRKKGAVVVRSRRPHPPVSTICISLKVLALYS